jgi:hypothetical protein
MYLKNIRATCQIGKCNTETGSGKSLAMDRDKELTTAVQFEFSVVLM